MDIHEYQAKEILASFGVTVPRGGIVYSPETAENKAREIGGSKWVVKAQIHSGARGKAEVVVCQSVELKGEEGEWSQGDVSVEIARPVAVPNQPVSDSVVHEYDLYLLSFM